MRYIQRRLRFYVKYPRSVHVAVPLCESLSVASATSGGPAEVPADFFAAAICHAGIALAVDPLDGKGLAFPSLRGDCTDGCMAAVGEVMGFEAPTGVSVVVALTGAGVSSFSRGSDGELLPPRTFPAPGYPTAVLAGWFDVGVGVGPVPSLFPINVFRLLNSAPNSFNLLSLPSFAPSRALGICSFRFRTSSLIRRPSSSRRLDAFLSSETTFSTSRRAASSFSVRDSSATLREAVSAESWSRRVKARMNSASMASLSC